MSGRSIAAVVLALSVSCATSRPAEVSPESAGPSDAGPAKAQPPALPMPPGLDEAAMDSTTDPCTDFYQYACGGWMTSTQIPGDRPLYTRGFIAIAERNEQRLKLIGEEAAAGKLADAPFSKQLGDYYATCLDEARLETGAKELQAILEPVLNGAPVRQAQGVRRSPGQRAEANGAGVKSANQLATTLAWLHERDLNPFFSLGPIQSFHQSSEIIGGLDQAGLGLPERDYYLLDDKKKVRDLYVAHVGAMFALWGLSADEVAPVIELETRLAKAQQRQVDRREPKNLDHRIDRAGLKKLAPAFPWDVYFEHLGLSALTAFNVNSETYFQELDAVFKETKPATLNAYLTWVAMRGLISALPAAFQAERFKYESAALTGAKVDRPRWKKCVSLADQDLPQVIGREFVKRFFGDDSKRTTRSMVNTVSAAMKRDFDTLPWMDEPTRAAARAKLDRMVEHNKIAFPDAWRDYSALTTSRESFLTNRIAARQVEKRRQLAKIGKPLDRSDWSTTPSTVNAYNDGQLNEIVFPAGILQPPFFNASATDEVNFGSMGMVVGHEITHGFDDEGRKFDVEGNFTDWWSPSSGKSFVDRASCVQHQFDSYLAIEDIHVKGDLTLGEDTADLGGLKIAHAAMVEWEKEKAPTSRSPSHGVAGPYRFDASQQFFLGFAQAWCTKLRPETARLRAATDPHAPPYWRVNGPLGNLDAFRVAFSCREGAPMIRKGLDKCEVW